MEGAHGKHASGAEQAKPERTSESKAITVHAAEQNADKEGPQKTPVSCSHKNARNSIFESTASYFGGETGGFSLFIHQ